MNTYDRLAREIADDKFGMPFLTPPQRKREDEILTLAETLFARFGRVKITMAVIARALRISGPTLRWHFSDTDALLGAILRRHLRRTSKYVGEAPRGDVGEAPPGDVGEAPPRDDIQEHQRRKREAYLTYTRGDNDGFTDVHKIFVHDRATLPHDIRDTFDDLYEGFGYSFAGDVPKEVMELLDNPRHDLASVENRLAAARAANAKRRAAEADPYFADPAAKPSAPSPPAPQTAAPPPSKLPNLKPTALFGPDMPADVAYKLVHGDLTWLRPAGLGSAGLQKEEPDYGSSEEELGEQSLLPQTPRH